MKHNLVVLINLGTPANPSPRSVGRYLREFLMDPLVLQMNWLGRWILVNLIIVPLRKYRSAALYKHIWTKAGSPLFVYTKNLSEKLRSNSYDTDFCFRYGHPSIEDVVKKIASKPYKEILFVPLYPQRADSSTTTSKLEWKRVLKKYPLTPNIRWMDDFYAEDFYIDSMAKILSGQLSQNFDHVIFSYHSIPESHLSAHSSLCETCLERGHCEKLVESCYRSQCENTSELLRKRLDLPREKLSVSYQSKLGRAKWITPSTEETLLKLAAEGKKRILLFAPGFICDCLETLEEIDFELRQKFIAAGGTELVRPLCLNDNADFVQNFQKFIQERL